VSNFFLPLAGHHCRVLSLQGMRGVFLPLPPEQRMFCYLYAWPSHGCSLVERSHAASILQEALTPRHVRSLSLSHVSRAPCMHGYFAPALSAGGVFRLPCLPRKQFVLSHHFAIALFDSIDAHCCPLVGQGIVLMLYMGCFTSATCAEDVSSRV